MHINDWSSDVCSSDLSARDPPHRQPPGRGTIQGLSSVASGQGRFRAIWIRREVTIWPLAPEEIETLRPSLKVSLAATAAILPIAFALAYVLARKRFPGQNGSAARRDRVCKYV